MCVFAISHSCTGSARNADASCSASVASSSCPMDRPLWFIDGEAYDLAEFVARHPGGAIYLCWRDRDWSIPFNTYHQNPTRAKAVISKYKVEDPNALKQLRAIHVPQSALPFLPQNFDARTAIPTYDFNPMNEKLFLNECKSRVLQPAVQTKLRDLDASFDKATGLIGAFYLCCLALWFSGSMAFYFSIPTFALLKTCFASSGHYFLHRTQFLLPF